MPVLYTAALAQGSVIVLHQAAASVVLVQLTDPDTLQKATARQEAVLGASSTIGLYLGSGILAVTTAARALAVDSFSYLMSAWCTSRIPTLPAPPAGAGRTTLTAEIRDGLRYTLRDPVLRPLALCLGATGAGAGVITAFSAWYLLTVVQLGPTGLGVIMGASGTGYLAGALASPTLIRWFGPGKVLIASVAVYPLLGVPLLTARPGGLWPAGLAVAGALQLAAAACATATVRMIRQRRCPPELQARTQQTATWLVAGSRPLAALGASVLAVAAGVWGTLLTGTLILAASALALWLSPIRHLNRLPDTTRPVTESSPAHMPQPPTTDTDKGVAPTTAAPVTPLSKALQSVAQLLVQGKTNAQIARQLWVSTHTVDSHIQSIRDHLHADTGCSRAVLAHTLLKHRLVRPPAVPELFDPSFAPNPEGLLLVRAFAEHSATTDIVRAAQITPGALRNRAHNLKLAMRADNRAHIVGLGHTLGILTPDPARHPAPADASLPVNPDPGPAPLLNPKSNL
ncbi:LuxR C-terminal-related transcriptional regulator [Streptomyces sp. IBSNAI002]|uniref:LuxR C-terminal-related transcriptional regulator n=1 Tax=Streptomyces sp. IBSNAI002 TaxID=3457500 RepID=UPI003FD5B7C0